MRECAVHARGGHSVAPHADATRQIEHGQRVATREPGPHEASRLNAPRRRHSPPASVLSDRGGRNGAAADPTPRSDARRSAVGRSNVARPLPATLARLIAAAGRPLRRRHLVPDRHRHRPHPAGRPAMRRSVLRLPACGNLSHRTSTGNQTTSLHQTQCGSTDHHARHGYHTVWLSVPVGGSTDQSARRPSRRQQCRQSTLRQRCLHCAAASGRPSSIAKASAGSTSCVVNARGAESNPSSVAVDELDLPTSVEPRQRLDVRRVRPFVLPPGAVPRRRRWKRSHDLVDVISTTLTRAQNSGGGTTGRTSPSTSSLPEP